LLSVDSEFPGRLAAAADKLYPGIFEFNQFNDARKAEDFVQTHFVRLIAVLPDIDVDIASFPDNIPLIYLTGTPAENTEPPDVSIYSGAGGILRAFLSVISGEKAVGKAQQGSVTVFSSPCGGAGVTSLSEAFAIRKAGAGRDTAEKRRVALLNLESCRSPSSLGYRERSGSVSDLILKVKLASSEPLSGLSNCFFSDQSSGGVFITSPPGFACDVGELTSQEIKRIIEELKNEFDHLVIDLPFSFSRVAAQVFSLADRIILVCGGGCFDPERVATAEAAFKKLEATEKANYCGKLCFVSNRASGTGKALSVPELIGRVPDLPEISLGDVSYAIASEAAFFDFV